MRGRKPKPKVILEMLGSKHAAGKQDLPVPEGELICPANLNDAAKAEWNRIAPVLQQMRVVTVADQGILAAYCLAHARLIKAEAEVAKLGEVVKSPSGYPIQNPWLSVATRAAKDLKAAAVELGLTPSARTRVKVNAATAEDAFQSFLNRGKKKA